MTKEDSQPSIPNDLRQELMMLVMMLTVPLWWW